MTASNTECRLPLVGAFQASNALVAAGLAMATGASAATVLPMLAIAAGRARAARSCRHRTRTALRSSSTMPTRPMRSPRRSMRLRPYVENRLVVVFGCGGDRDKGKRPEMGRVAAAKADLAIVTDDNPRSEDPAAIRRQILTAAPGAIEIGDRAAAIAEAIARLERGRCAARRRQRPRDRSDHRDDRHSLFRSRRGCSRAEARGEMWLSRSGPWARS